jgi:hypothetical protein
MKVGQVYKRRRTDRPPENMGWGQAIVIGVLTALMWVAIAVGLINSAMP